MMRKDSYCYLYGKEFPENFEISTSFLPRMRAASAPREHRKMAERVRIARNAYTAQSVFEAVLGTILVHFPIKSGAYGETLTLKPVYERASDP